MSIPRHWTPDDPALAAVANLPLDTPAQRKAATADPAWAMWCAANGDVGRAQQTARAALVEVERLRGILRANNINFDE